jgi:glycosyltransferase involved in cell wall biosynthesis
MVVHVSSAQIGGAESSLMAAVAAVLEAAPPSASAAPPLFLVPSEGPLSRAVAARGWDYRVLPWPRGLAALTQTRWLALPLLPGLIPYLFRLAGALRGADRVWSSGAKSHAACLALSPWLRSRAQFDVRDFLRSRLLRKAIAGASARFGCRVSANSRAVAAAYPGATVRYPEVSLRRPAVDRREAGGKRVISHLAYFAPYKGQDLFLNCARTLLDAGVDAEFWVIGDVIYPAEAYARYRERLYGLVGSLRLDGHVRFLGKVEGAEEVQTLLERTHLLLHCTVEPEPYGRSVMEALLCGCEVVCHKGSGVCEAASVVPGFPDWARPIGDLLGTDYVGLKLPAAGAA